MKAVKVDVEQVEGEGLVALLGKKVWIWCMNYTYAGTLAGVNETCILLEDAKVVYETGPLTASTLKDAQPFAGEHYVRLAAIESFGPCTHA